MANWAKHDGCAADPAAKSFSAAVEVRRWTSCRAGVAVDFYVIKGGGHTWPGASRDVAALGPTTSEIDASAVLWDFFKAHALPST
jgi:polyhydroxybutyrate depolymerase